MKHKENFYVRRNGTHWIRYLEGTFALPFVIEPPVAAAFKKTKEPEKEVIDNSDQFSNLVIYPNPADDKLFVKHQFSSPAYYEVSNSVGQVLLKGYIKPAGQYIDIRQLNAGAYILSIKEDNSKVNQFKFIKK